MSAGSNKITVAVGQPIRGVTYADMRSMCDEIEEPVLRVLAQHVRSSATMSRVELSHAVATLVASGEFVLMKELSAPLTITDDGWFDAPAPR